MAQLIKTTHQQVAATLRAAGFVPHKHTRREARNGFKVTRCSPAVVCVDYKDWQDIGDRAEKFAACVDALEAAGYVLCGNPAGSRVWDRDQARAIGERCGIIGIARRAD